jgi:hypothetical protein
MRSPGEGDGDGLPAFAGGEGHEALPVRRRGSCSSGLEKAKADPSTHHPKLEKTLGAPFAQDDISI